MYLPGEPLPKTTIGKRQRFTLQNNETTRASNNSTA
jgi:hypothetical protein